MPLSSLPPRATSLTVAQRATDRGQIVVRRIRPGLLHSTASGHICRAMIETLMRAADEEIATTSGSFEHFLDWSGVDSYDTDARVAATQWALDKTAPYPRLHIVTKNRLLNMGVAAASLALEVAGRPLHAYLSVDSFNTELASRRA